MKQSDAIKLMLAGTPVIKTEYRNLKKDQQKYRDKKTGSMVTRDVVKHLCEFQNGSASLEVMQWLEEGQTADSIPAAFRKGTEVFFVIKSLEQVSYGAAFTGEGTFEPITPEVEDVPMGDASKPSNPKAK